MTGRFGGRKTMRMSQVAALGLFVGALVPSRAEAQVQRCAWRSGFPTACATLQFIEFDPLSGSLTLVVSNTSAAAAHPESYIGFLLLKFNMTPPDLGIPPQANVQYGTWTGSMFNPSSGDPETWNITQPVPGKPGGFGIEWDQKLNDPSTGGGDLRVLPNMAVQITIQFTGSVQNLALVDWSAHMEGLGGLDAQGSGYTSVVPEPATVVLLTTGLLVLGGVGLRRRRREAVDL